MDLNTQKKECHLRPAAILAAGLFFIMLCFSGAAHGQSVKTDDPALRGVDVAEHLGDTIPMNVKLINDAGEPVTVGDYFKDGKPVDQIIGAVAKDAILNKVKPLF